MNYYVYIVECIDKSLYTGFTNNVQRRIFEHNNSKRGAKSVRGRRPVKLVYYESFDAKSEAMQREREIKSWKREKKLELVLKKRV